MIHRLSIFAFRSTAILAFTCMAALAQDTPAHSSTLLGGNGSQESAQAVVLASNGDLIIAGKTDSTDLPGAIGGFDSTYNGLGDAFVARLSHDGTQLLAATYLGGTFPDQAVFVHEAADGSIWVGGTTQSAEFPTTPDAFLTHSDRQDAFVVSFDADLTVMQYGSTFGSPGRDYGEAFAVDDQNELVYLSGRTVLRTTALPVSPTAFKGAVVGGSELYLAVLDLSPPDSTLLAYGTFIGGSGDEREVGDLILEGNGIVTISGRTNSTDFPVTAGAVQTTGGGVAESGIITRIDTQASGAAGLLYSTYLGGSLSETKVRHDIDAGGVVHVMLESVSTDLPVTANALFSTSGLGSDVYYAQLDPNQEGVAGLLYGSWIVTAGNSDLVADLACAAGKVAMLVQAGGSGHYVTPDAFMPSAFSGGHGYIVELDVSTGPDPFVSYATHYAGCPVPGSSVRPDALLYDGHEVVLAGSASLLPFTPGAFQSQAASNLDAFVGRLELSTWPTFSSFGSGCAGTAGTPQLIADSTARLCRSLDLEVSANLPSGLGAILLGFDPTQYLGIPLPASLAGLGAAGCEMLVPPKRVFATFADPAGIASISIPVPNNPSVLGLPVYAQWALLDAAANPLGVVVSNGIRTELRW